MVSENEQLRARISELENQQVECEEKLAAMVIQAQEYASRLQQAQDTIHSLSEPKLQDDDDLNSMSTTFNSFSVSSQDGLKESEITKVSNYTHSLTHRHKNFDIFFFSPIRDQYFLLNLDKKCKKRLNVTLT